ncbi:MAG: PilZ domain-containing protein [candidate division NC10 bacterium]|nr:PilZ domain-containing protein [candidate division NC10 bacterium]
MGNPANKRSRIRKSFNQAIPLERIAAESKRMRHLQEEAVCLDISEGGLGLTADRTLKRGEILKLFLPVKKVHTKPPVFAEVVWATRSNGHFRVGLRILQ